MSSAGKCVALATALMLLVACGGGSGGAPRVNSNGDTNGDTNGGSTSDTTPDSFNLASISNAAPGLQYEATMTVSGINSAAPISVGSGEYRIGAGGFTAAAGTVTNGQTVTVRATAASALETLHRTVLTIGGVTQNFDITTGDSTLEVQSGFKTVVFDWSAFNGVDHYQLSVNADGVSGFTAVADDIAGDADHHVHELPVHLTDWINARFQLEACDANDACVVIPQHEISLTQALSAQAIGYIKASNTGAGDLFGQALSLSADGQTLAVGAYLEDSADAADQSDNAAFSSGAVYVFHRNAVGVWVQEAYLKASNVAADDQFGFSVSLSGDGRVLAVGAYHEDSAAAADPGNNDASNSGAAYVFEKGETEWVQSAYLKAASIDANDFFGVSVSLNADGTLLAVGASGDDGPSNLVSSAGAVYVFEKEATGVWSSGSYIGATVPGTGNGFGTKTSWSADGQTLAVSARTESSSSTGVNQDPDNTDAPSSGAVYVFDKDGAGDWAQTAYIKASNTESGDLFGIGLSLSADGRTLAVGANAEDSADAGDQADNSAGTSGAVYVFEKDAMGWSQSAYLKASTIDVSDNFGISVALNAAGNILVVGALQESSAAVGIDGDQADDSLNKSGAAYVFEKSDMGWSQRHYLKASNPGAYSWFGLSLGLSADGKTLAIAANTEGSAAVGMDGDQVNDCDAAPEDQVNCAANSGAVYVY